MSTPELNPYADPISTAAPLSPAEEKQWALLTHILGIFVGVPTAVIFYVLYRDRGPFVRTHTATELNFQITVLIFSAVGFVISFSSVFLSIGASSNGAGGPSGVGFFFVGYFLFLALRVVAVVLGILASMAAHRGKLYKYPAFQFVK